MDFDATAEIARFFSIPMSVSHPLAGTHDFNGDGNSDIVWRDSSGNVAIWLMNGADGVVVGRRWRRAQHLVDRRAARLRWRRQGRPAVAGHQRQQRHLVHERQRRSPRPPPSATIPTSWTVVGTGDFNGDGLGDILWGDSNGNLAVWLMNGANVVSSGASAPSRRPGRWPASATSTATARPIFCGATPAATLRVVHERHAGGVRGRNKHRPDDLVGGRNRRLQRRRHCRHRLAGQQRKHGDLAHERRSVLAAGGLGNVTTSWSMVQTGDYNGDGMSDLLVARHQRQHRDVVHERDGDRVDGGCRQYSDDLDGAIGQC